MDGREINKLETKLVRAITKAGLSWTTYSAIIEIVDNVYGIKLDPLAAPACWYYNNLTKQEKIAIHPEFVRDNKIEDIVLVIKHEMLHKAMYRGLPDTKDQLLTNVCLDAAINKILFLAEPKRMIGLTSWLYSGENRLSPLAICNPSINNTERLYIEKKIRDIFDEIYFNDELNCTAAELLNSMSKINPTIPDPMNLYYKLSIVLNGEDKNKVKQNNPLLDQSQDNKSSGKGGEGTQNETQNQENNNQESEEIEKQQNKREDEKTENKTEDKKEEKQEDEKKQSGNKTPKPSDLNIRGSNPRFRDNKKNTIQAENEISKEIEQKVRGNSYSATKNLQETFQKYIYKSKEHETQDLKKFIETWTTMRQVEGIEHSIYAEIASQARFDPIIQNLSRTGLEYVALGVSGPDALPFYLNLSDKTSCKKKVCCYLDVSPSMLELVPYMVHFVEFFSGLDECELSGGDFNGKYTFASSVKGLNDQEWEEFQKGNVKTGGGTCFEEVIKHSLECISAEDTDIILIVTDGQSGISDEIAEKFNETTKTCYRIYIDPNIKEDIVSDLDKLNGSSYTLSVESHHGKK